MLIPMLKAMRSILSRLSEEVLIGSFAGKNAFMKAYPGKNSTNITPKTLRTYASGYPSCGIVKTVIVVATATAIIAQYHANPEVKR